MLNFLFRHFENFIDSYPTDGVKGFGKGGVLGLLGLSGRLWITSGFLAFVGLTISIVEVLLPLFVGKVMEDLITARESGAAPLSAASTDIAWLLAIIASRPICGTLETLLGEQTLQSRLSPLLRWRAHFLVLGFRRRGTQELSPGDLGSKVWQTGQAGSEFLGVALRTAWPNVVFIVSVLSVVFYINPLFSLIIFVWFAGFTGIALFNIPRTRARSRASAEMSGRVNAQLVDCYSNKNTLQSFSTRQNEERHFRFYLGDFAHKSALFLRSISTTRIMVSTLNGFMILCVAYLTWSLWGSNSINAGELTTITGLVIRIESQFETIMSFLTGLYRSYGAYQASVAALPDPALDSYVLREDGQALPQGAADQAAPAVQFLDVTFGYPGAEEPLFADLSLHINKGEHVAIVGRSGSGKSTIAKLVCGDVRPLAGSVSVLGKAVADTSFDWVRDRTTLCAQDSALLRRTLGENIAFSASYEADSKLEHAIEAAGVSDFLAGVRDVHGRTSLDALMTEGQSSLSGGQRQRVSLARALYKSGDVLIFDEPTTGLDSHATAKFYESLKRSWNGKTVLTILHDLRRIPEYDRVIFLDDEGIRIADHATLQATSASYAEMCSLQDVPGFLNLGSSPEKMTS